jgi:hypothetical protein
MHDVGLDQFIDTLRGLAPLDGAPATGTGTAESIAATDVVDGLVLLRKFHDDPQFWSTPGLPPPGLPPAGVLRDQLTAQIKRLDDALDAVADLALAESVHQLVRGNMIRAGATLDAIARGDAPPLELDVVQTPRAGTALTHRLLAIAASNAPRTGGAATQFLGRDTAGHPFPDTGTRTIRRFYRRRIGQCRIWLG